MDKLLRHLLIAVGLFLPLAFSEGASAQNCTPLPVGCQRANDKAMQFVNRINAGGVSGIVDAASKQYCAILVAIETNNLCAAEFRRVGNAACASVVESQSLQYRQALPQAEAAASAASVINARNKCSFE